MLVRLVCIFDFPTLHDPRKWGGVIVRLDLPSVPVLKGTRASPLLVVLVDLDLRSGHLATILQNM